MYVLIVDGFDDSIKGSGDYEIYKELVVKTFKECKVLDCSFLERKINRLGDLVVDWEHDSLNDESRENCKHFDKIDFVFIGGDMKICPWEPVATQVVNLIHMCKFMKKPLFCSGFGAFSAIYTLATKGARFHVLNGPNGEEIEHLSHFPRYSIGTGAYPSGWFDNETGDLYTYNRKTASWDPVCNLGIYRIAANGTPSSNRHAPLSKKYAREDHLLDARQIIEPLDVDATITRIRSVHLQHYAMRGFEAQSFVSKEYPHWYIRTDGSLPAGERLFVVANSEKGAVVLSKDRMLLVTSKVDKSLSYASYRKIMNNYVVTIMKQTKQANRDKLEDSMLEFLFGADGVSGGTYDSMLARMKMSPPLARTSVRSSLPEGPVKVDPPVIGMFLYTPKQDNVDYLALTASRRYSTIGRMPHLRVQNPLEARHKRLEQLSAKVGGINVTAIASESLALSKLMNPDSDDGVPEQVKELFAGIVMNTNSVSKRRSPRSRSNSPQLLRTVPEPPQSPLPESDWDREVEGDYQLEQFVLPFGVTLVVPGTESSVRVGSTKIGSSYDSRDPFDQAKSEDSSDRRGVSFSADDSVGGDFENSESLLTVNTVNNVPFASTHSAPIYTSPAPKLRPQQPSTPQSSASACRMASKINREFRQRAQSAQSTEANSPANGAKRPFTSPSAVDDDADSSDEESSDMRPPQPSLVSALSVDSADVGGEGVSGWSSMQGGASRVPPFKNWNQALAQTAQTQPGSPFATIENSMETYSTRRNKFNPYGSNLTGSQTERRMNTSSLLAPTMSSLQRTSLTSSIGAVRPAPPPATPMPNSARTAGDINSTLRALYMPVQRPAGPVLRRRVNTAHIEPELSEAIDDGLSFVYLSEPNADAHQEIDIVDESKVSTFHQYHDVTAPQILLPTTPSERPYSSYQKITQRLIEKQARESRQYPGAYTREFLHPEEIQRKEYMQSKQKFLAGAFKTSFGRAQTSLELRKEGYVRGEGQYPLEPPGPMTARPEHTTAVHFASMQRSHVPKLAGDWK